MRLVLALVVASVIGSGLAGAIQFALSARSSNPFPELIRLYEEDRTATLLLLEQASILCVPEFKEIRSSTVRGVLARTFLFSIETSLPLGDDSTREERNQKLAGIIGHMLRGASEADVAVLDDFLRRPDKQEVLTCVARIATEKSKSRNESSKSLLEDVEMRR